MLRLARTFFSLKCCFGRKPQRFFGLERLTVGSLLPRHLIYKHNLLASKPIHWREVSALVKPPDGNSRRLMDGLLSVQGSLLFKHCCERSVRRRPWFCRRSWIHRKESGGGDSSQEVRADSCWWMDVLIIPPQHLFKCLLNSGRCLDLECFSNLLEYFTRLS